MNGLMIYNNPEFGEIRTIEEGGAPWFVALDVAMALGYQNGSRDINRHVDEEDRRAVTVHDGRQNRTMTIINESGLYSLIISSKLPGAKRFKRWVTAEVLPSIRKHGAYIGPDTLEDMLASPDFVVKLLTALKAEQDKNRGIKTTVPRMRTIPKAAAEIREKDPKTHLTLTTLRRLVKTGVIPVVQAGKSPLINMNNLERYMGEV